MLCRTEAQSRFLFHICIRSGDLPPAIFTLSTHYHLDLDLSDFWWKWYLYFTELEVLEACSWLQEAGFPQYVQLYHDSQFPVDLQSVERDHSFLDQQQIQSLFRWAMVLSNIILLILATSGLSEHKAGAPSNLKWHHCCCPFMIEPAALDHSFTANQNMIYAPRQPFCYIHEHTDPV